LETTRRAVRTEENRPTATVGDSPNEMQAVRGLHVTDPTDLALVRISCTRAATSTTGTCGWPSDRRLDATLWRTRVGIILINKPSFLAGSVPSLARQMMQ